MVKSFMAKIKAIDEKKAFWSQVVNTFFNKQLMVAASMKCENMNIISVFFSIVSKVP